MWCRYEVSGREQIKPVRQSKRHMIVLLKFHNVITRTPLWLHHSKIFVRCRLRFSVVIAVTTALFFPSDRKKIIRACAWTVPYRFDRFIIWKMTGNGLQKSSGKPVRYELRRLTLKTFGFFVIRQSFEKKQSYQLFVNILRTFICL